MNIVCVSDLHGHLPPIPECDLVIIGGDICPGTNPISQMWWLREEFAKWMSEVKAPIVATWGNHDFIGEKTPHLIPKLNWTLLVDKPGVVAGVRCYGSPWQLRFGDWAFNADEPYMERKWSHIPDDTQILVLHGPPFQAGDKVFRFEEDTKNDWEEHTGSPSLRKRIEELPDLKLVVCGHIHCSRGMYKVGNAIVVNAAVVNERYEMVHPPTTVEIDFSE